MSELTREMTPSTFMAIILGFWSSLHLIHSFLMNKTQFGHHVSSFLINCNISISFFHVRWFTARWNRCFIRMGRMCNTKLKLWFDAGIIFAAVAMVAGTVLLCNTLYTTVLQIFFKPEQPVPDQQVLSIIVPGVNFPIRDLGYLLSSIFLSGILHELGHAVAAAREGIHINGFGMFVFLIYPGAFVDLNSDDMNRKDPVCQLRVYCAGVWHNFVICVAVCGFIMCLPAILFPFYTTHGEGVLVTYQMADSPLQGKMGLRVGDHLLKIDSCHVANTTDWLYCINKTKKTSQWGSCVSKKKITNLMSHTAYTMSNPESHETSPHKRFWMDCCDVHAPQTHLCYQYQSSSSSKEMMFACLPGRVMMGAQDDCMSKDDCENDDQSDDTVCAKAYTEPGVKFIRLVVSRDQSENRKVLYIGDPVDILRSVTVADLFPRFSILPLRLPAILLRFLQYMFSMSGALALLNIVPCYALDGQWAFITFFNYADPDDYYISRRGKGTICKFFLICGTLLLAGNIFFGFVHLFTR